MEATELFIGTNLTAGMAARLERVRRGWRQVDVARMAGVTQAEVSAFERDRYVIPVVRLRIWKALGLAVEEGTRGPG